MKKYLLCLLLPFNVFAHDCDELQAKVTKYENLCNTGEDVTNIVGIGATILAPFTAGLSMTITVIPAASTEWVCRHKDFLTKALGDCNKGTNIQYWTDAYNKLVRAESMERHKKAIDQAGVSLKEMYHMLAQNYDTALEVFRNNCNRNGFDLGADENLEYVQTVLQVIEDQYNHDIAYYDFKYEKDIAGHLQLAEQEKLKAKWKAENRNFYEIPKLYGQKHQVDLSCRADSPNSKDGL